MLLPKTKNSANLDYLKSEHVSSPNPIKAASPCVTTASGAQITQQSGCCERAIGDEHAGKRKCL